jgi:hypothetical protein
MSIEWLEESDTLKKRINYLIGNRTCDLPASSIVLSLLRYCSPRISINYKKDENKIFNARNRHSSRGQSVIFVMMQLSNNN